jgi:hypothetical protein
MHALPLTHTRTHPMTLLSHSLTHALSFSRARTHTRTHTHSLSHAHIHRYPNLPNIDFTLFFGDDPPLDLEVPVWTAFKGEPHTMAVAVPNSGHAR